MTNIVDHMTLFSRFEYNIYGAHEDKPKSLHHIGHKLAIDDDELVVYGIFDPAFRSIMG